MILALFVHSEKQYVYVLENNKIKYGYKDNNSFCYDLSQAEIRLMDEIYENIMISKDGNNHRKCGKVQYSGKIFQVMYDKISRQKFFYEIKDGQYTVPSYEDYIYLENKLNPSICYKIPKGGRTLRDIGCSLREKIVKGISVFLSSVMLFHSVNQVLPNEVKTIDYGNIIPFYQTVEGFNDIVKHTLLTVFLNVNNMDLTINDLYVILNNNPFLSDAEKNFIADHFPVIKENIDYLDMNLIAKRLNSVYMRYFKELPSSDSPFFMIAGEYYPSLNKICIYGHSDFESASKNAEETMTHETYHMFFIPKEWSLGVKLLEAINEIMTREYNNYDLNPTTGSYALERICTYMLLEILDIEDIKRFCLHGGDSQILIDALTDIIDDENKAYELISFIDNVRFTDDEARLKNSDYQYYSILAPYINLISEYFTAKYGYSVYEDQIMSYYIAMATDDLQRIFAENNIYSELYEDMANNGFNEYQLGIIAGSQSLTPKIYFSEKLMQNAHEEDGQPVIKLTYTIVLRSQDHNGEIHHEIPITKTIKVPERVIQNNRTLAN